MMSDELFEKLPAEQQAWLGRRALRDRVLVSRVLLRVVMAGIERIQLTETDMGLLPGSAPVPRCQWGVPGCMDTTAHVHTDPVVVQPLRDRSPDCVHQCWKLIQESAP
jgi:hypothetical protein